MLRCLTVRPVGPTESSPHGLADIDFETNEDVVAESAGSYDSAPPTGTERSTGSATTGRAPC